MDNHNGATKSPTGKAATVPALLDLDAALEEFSSVVTPLLKVGGETNWDGPQFLAREQAILQSALVLAGQCIALLFADVVSSPQVQQTARERTRPLRQPTSVGHGKRRVNITLIGGVRVPLLVEYIVARNPRKRRGRPRQRRGVAQQQGFYPVLSLLGSADRLSPLVRSLVAEYGNLSISFASAQHALTQIGIVMSIKRIARVTHAFNQVGLQQRQHWMEQYRQGSLPTGASLQGQRVVLSVDGGRTRIRRPKPGRRRKGSRRHGYHADWREPKLLTIYIVDKRGRKVKKGHVPITNDGTFAGVEAFMDLLGMHLTRLGIRHAHWIHLIGDGAAWIWERIPTLLQQLACPADIISETIDFCHAVGKLSDFAELAGVTQSETQAWFRKERRFLKRGQVGKVLGHMEALLTSAQAASRQELQTTYEYFDKHQHRMAYDQLAQSGLPIGSGAVESLIRQVVNLRLKCTGKFWLKPHAEGMLLARCCWAASRWEQFRDLVLTARLVPLPSN